MISPVEQLRMKAAAVGLPVPKIAEQMNTSRCFPDLTQSLKTEALLKPFKSDSAKQARFDAFQVLVRRGFTSQWDVAWWRSACPALLPMFHLFLLFISNLSMDSSNKVSKSSSAWGFIGHNLLWEAPSPGYPFSTTSSNNVEIRDGSFFLKWKNKRHSPLLII